MKKLPFEPDEIYFYKPHSKFLKIGLRVLVFLIGWLIGSLLF